MKERESLVGGCSILKLYRLVAIQEEVAGVRVQSMAMEGRQVPEAPYAVAQLPVCLTMSIMG